jgi:hypothetical protein
MRMAGGQAHHATICADTARMRWLARLLLLRVLPRRLLPILTVWEVWKIVRGQQQAARDRRRVTAAAALDQGPEAQPLTPGPARRRPTTR